MNRKVLIILTNFNKWEETIECLESLLKLNTITFQVLVVENGSANDSMVKMVEWAKGEREIDINRTNEGLKKYVLPITSKPISFHCINENDFNSINPTELASKKVIFIQVNVNRGFASGNNAGIKLAKKLSYDYLWFLGNDTVVPPDSLDKLLERSENSPKEGITGSVLLFYHKPDTLQAVGGHFNYLFATGSNLMEGVRREDFPKMLPVKISYPIGASLLVKRKFIEEVGEMCEDYHLYYEEIDWVERGKRKGYTIGFAPDSFVYHKEGATIGIDHAKKWKSEYSDFYSLTNRVAFSKKYNRKNLLTVYLGLMLALINRVRRGQMSRSIKIVKHLFAS